MLKQKAAPQKRSMSIAQDPNKQKSNGEEIFTKTAIKDTPFTIISKDGKHFGVFGAYKLTEEYTNKEQLKKDLQEITWNRIIQVCAIIWDLNTKPLSTKK